MWYAASSFAPLSFLFQTYPKTSGSTQANILSQALQFQMWVFFLGDDYMIHEAS